MVAAEEPSKEEWLRIGGWKATLYVYGAIRYTDAFGVCRVTTFRLESAPEDIRTTNRGKELIVCSEGNSMS